MSHYLYTCYCGPQKTRLQAERGGGGYIYDNCPALTAPAINNKLEDLTDYRTKFIINNLEEIIKIFKKYNCTKAHLIGSFVQNQTKSSSDIDFVTDVSFEDKELLLEISKELTDLIGHTCDVTAYFFLSAFPHSALDKASILLFDNNANGTI